jgi:hypothetical protein
MSWKTNTETGQAFSTSSPSRRVYRALPAPHEQMPEYAAVESPKEPGMYLRVKEGSGGTRTYSIDDSTLSDDISMSEGGEAVAERVLRPGDEEYYVLDYAGPGQRSMRGDSYYVGSVDDQDEIGVDAPSE